MRRRERNLVVRGWLIGKGEREGGGGRKEKGMERKEEKRLKGKEEKGLKGMEIGWVSQRVK